MHDLLALYRTPLAQTILLGLIFLFLFAAYTTIQFYAASTYGPTLAANSVSALYATFTVSCFVAPVSRLRPQVALAVGIVGGYVTFVILSLLYFQGYCGSEIVILGGVLLGFGAALLWTAQGQLLLEYAAVADQLAATECHGEEGLSTDKRQQQSGSLLGLFWAVFQCSSLVGGVISCSYYFHIDPMTEDKPTGSIRLYVIFLSLMIASAILTQCLLSPSSLVPTDNAEQAANQDTTKMLHNHVISEETALLRGENAATTTINNKASKDRRHWMKEASAMVPLFTRNQSMQLLSLLFFYTGFNQPYQQAIYTRFFSKRTIGVELILFHVMEIVGAILCGRLLDQPRVTAKTKGVICIAMFLIINATGNAIALIQEQEAGETLSMVDIADSTFLRPSVAVFCWGFADAHIQVYCYWLLGRLLRGDVSRAVAFYKCLQSLGYSLGFYLIPETRLSAMHQLLISSGVFLLGAGLAAMRLPS